MERYVLPVSFFEIRAGTVICPIDLDGIFAHLESSGFYVSIGDQASRETSQPCMQPFISDNGNVPELMLRSCRSTFGGKRDDNSPAQVRSAKCPSRILSPLSSEFITRRCGLRASKMLELSRQNCHRSKPVRSAVATLFPSLATNF